MENKNYFIELNSINVNDKVEKKNGLTYLSWAWAWGEVKKLYPTANYKIYETNEGINYFTDGRTGWVKTGVIINDIEHIEYLPIMDYKNKSIPLEQITSFDVNKTIQRSLTKAVARHGLGLYIYAGEDLPEEKQENAENKDFQIERKQINEQPKETPKKAQKKADNSDLPFTDTKDLVNKYVSAGKVDAEIEETSINTLEALKQKLYIQIGCINAKADDVIGYFSKRYNKPFSEWTIQDFQEITNIMEERVRRDS